MIIPDTSIWIDFFRGKDPYLTILGNEFDKGGVLGLPWIFGELLQGARNSSESKLLMKTWKVIPKPELRSLESAWLSAGESSRHGKWYSRGVGLIDAAIIAIAEELHFKVWTHDKQLTSILKFKKLLWEERPLRR